MKRSACCKSELVYVTDGVIKIDRHDIPALNKLMEERLKNIDEPSAFYRECGICHKECELTERPDFTNEQIDWICYQIGDWYLDWRHRIANYEEKTHMLGYAKEGLKMMICGDRNKDENI